MTADVSQSSLTWGKVEQENFKSLVDFNERNSYKI